MSPHDEESELPLQTPSRQTDGWMSPQTILALVALLISTISAAFSWDQAERNREQAVMLNSARVDAFVNMDSKVYSATPVGADWSGNMCEIKTTVNQQSGVKSPEAPLSFNASLWHAVVSVRHSSGLAAKSVSLVIHAARPIYGVFVQFPKLGASASCSDTRMAAYATIPSLGPKQSLSFDVLYQTDPVHAGTPNPAIPSFPFEGPPTIETSCENCLTDRVEVDPLLDVLARMGSWLQNH